MRKIIVQNDQVTLNQSAGFGPLEVVVVASKGVLSITDAKDKGVKLAILPVSAGSVPSKTAIDLVKQDVEVNWSRS